MSSGPLRTGCRLRTGGTHQRRLALAGLPRRGDTRHQRIEVRVLGRGFGESLLQGGELVDPALVAPAFEGRGEPQLGDLVGQSLGDDAGTDRQHVGVVVLADIRAV